MSDSRERFERWAHSNGVNEKVAWEAWQAAERDTRERCAKQMSALILEIAEYANQMDSRDVAQQGKWIRNKFLTRADAIRKGE